MDERFHSALFRSCFRSGVTDIHRVIRASQRKFRHLTRRGDFHRTRESAKPRDPRLFTGVTACDSEKILSNKSIGRQQNPPLQATKLAVKWTLIDQALKSCALHLWEKKTTRFVETFHRVRLLDKYIRTISITSVNSRCKSRYRFLRSQTFVLRAAGIIWDVRRSEVNEAAIST